MDKKAAALYLRVSTDDQNTDNQLLALSRWLETRDLKIAAVYQEKESAWKAGHQSELARLRADAKKRTRAFDYVVVWSLDRLSRQGALQSLLIVKAFEDIKVNVLSYQEQWLDTLGSMKDVFIALLGWIAESESARRSERTKAGIARKRATGWKAGRPKGATDKRKRKKRKDTL